MAQDNTFLVTRIIHGSYVDGPGMRTVVFLKGCPLQCGWCQNPETQQRMPEILYDARQCIRCCSCVDSCRDTAVDLEKEYIINREQCTLCLKCVDECPSGALQVAGREMSVDDVMAEIVKDTIFYESSGGGVTFSGGEPLLYCSPLCHLLRICRRRGVHTSIDTSGAVPWDHFEYVMEDADLFMVDIKHSTRTELMTDQVFANCERLARTNRIWIRIPVIPGLNDTDEEMRNIAGKLTQFKNGIERICLLPFHNTAEMKYRYLNREWKVYAEEKELSWELLNGFGEIFKKKNLQVTVGG